MTNFILGSFLYVFSGIFWSNFLELILKDTGQIEDELPRTEKTIAVIVWPISFIIFVVTFLSSFFTNLND